MDDPMKIVFLGGGNMATALISGLLSKGIAANNILSVDISEEARSKLDAIGVRTAAAYEDSGFNPDVVVFAVKPQNLKIVVDSCAALLPKSLIITIVAGIQTSTIAEWLGGHQRIVRVMPNTPALIKAGISGLFAPQTLDSRDRDMAEEIISAVGKCVWCDEESKIDAVTALSGSGPAYVFYFIEALEKAALEFGFDAEASRAFAIETFLGSSRLAARSDDPPSVLREKVTSKGGTTAAALASFASDQLSELFIKGVKASEARAQELGAEFGEKLK
jgi:pyrroline-5-carboxylate reductase